MKKVIFIFLIFILFFSFQCKKNEIKKNVTVSILPQKYFVKRITGDKFNINVMVGPGLEPHTYEPLPKQMIELSDSELYFTIGLPFEEVLLKKISNINKNIKIIKTQEGIVLREFNGYESHDNKEGDYQNNRDPHIWLSPKLVEIQAKNIYNAVVLFDPGNKDFYKKNFDEFILDLENLSRGIKEAFSNIRNKEFVVFHPSWGYFADEFGLKQIPIEVEGKEPTPKQLASIIKLAKEKNIKVIFVQKQFSMTSAKAIAKEINGIVVAIDPLSEDYINNLRNITETIKKYIR